MCQNLLYRDHESHDSPSSTIHTLGDGGYPRQNWRVNNPWWISPSSNLVTLREKSSRDPLHIRRWSFSHVKEPPSSCSSDFPPRIRPTVLHFHCKLRPSSTLPYLLYHVTLALYGTFDEMKRQPIKLHLRTIYALPLIRMTLSTCITYPVSTESWTLLELSRDIFE